MERRGESDQSNGIGNSRSSSESQGGGAVERKGMADGEGDRPTFKGAEMLPDSAFRDGILPDNSSGDVSVSDQAVVSSSEEPDDLYADKSRGGVEWKVGSSRAVSLSQLPAEGRRLSGGKYTSSIVRLPQDSDKTHMKAIKLLLRPFEWRPPADRSFPLTVVEIEELITSSEALFKSEPACLKLQSPIKVYGDIHGQFADLMRLFAAYGSPSKLLPNGDINGFDYLFLGDYVDRGHHSLEVICLLMALKLESPTHIHLIRGNHEAARVNCMFGLMSECCERLGNEGGSHIWNRLNTMFDWLPLGATIAGKILCIHGGIGQLVHTVADIESIERPCTVDLEGPPSIAKDLLWSDPTPHDAVEGITKSRRGPGVCAFGPDQVHKFCRRNHIDLILRAHECVMDGFERFAGGRLITIFSASNYCGTVGNAGAMVVIGRDLELVPKLIQCPPSPMLKYMPGGSMPTMASGSPPGSPRRESLSVRTGRQNDSKDPGSPSVRPRIEPEINKPGPSRFAFSFTEFADG